MGPLRGSRRAFTLLAVAVAVAVTAPTATGAAKAKSKPGGFRCTQVMGVSVTADWFSAGFETMVDDARFQAVTRKHAFIEYWADPANEIWKVPVTSPCRAGADAPDRIVFTAVSWTLKSADEWTATLGKVVAALKARYPKAERIELLTMLRGPGNQTCGNDKTVVAPYIDEAIARVVKTAGGGVTAGPKVEAPGCAVFKNQGPHFETEGMNTVAKTYAAHYAKN